MKTTHKLLAILFTVSAAAHGQVVPAATGPRGLPVGGNLDYTFRYSQTAELSGTLGNQQRTTASGNVDYTNTSTRLPFNLEYGGGYIWTIAGPSYATGLFQNLLLSQGIVWRNWNVMASDNASYRPAAPTTGFSGIPGTGEPVGGSGPTPPSSQSILTLNTHVVNNLANGEVEDRLNYATTLSAGGGSDILRYPDGNGLDTDTLMANAALTWHQNARNSFSGTYGFSEYSYPGYSVTFMSNTVLFGYQRHWNRRLSTSAGVGPEWIGSADTSVVPNSTRISANAAIDYTLRFGTAGLSYNHGTNGGAVYMLGAESDSVDANFSRELRTTVTLGITGAYRRTAGLNNNGVTNSMIWGAQATRRLGRYLTAFANYTAIDQSTSSPLPTNALTHLMQVIGFGVGYSPRGTRLVRP